MYYQYDQTLTYLELDRARSSTSKQSYGYQSLLFDHETVYGSKGAKAP